MDAKIIDLLEDVFEEDIEFLRSSESFQDLDAWDSLTYVSLITRLQKIIGVRLSKEEIQSLTSYKALEKIINENPPQ